MPIDTALLMMQARLHMSGRETDSLKTKLANLAGKEGVGIQAIFGKASGLSGQYGADGLLKILAASARAARTLKILRSTRPRTGFPR